MWMVGMSRKKKGKRKSNEVRLHLLAYPTWKTKIALDMGGCAVVDTTAE